MGSDFAVENLTKNNKNVIVNDEVVGKIIRIEKDRYQDKIVVNKDGTTCLVPYVCDIIDKIDLNDGCITIKYIKGLLD
jgi:ribosomal 30S subunit maturation factor RimM